MMIDHIHGSSFGLRPTANTASGSAEEAASQPGSISTGSPEPARDTPSLESVKAAVDELNEHVQRKPASIHFSLDAETGRTIIKMIDTETNQVVRQIPSEEILAISKALDRLQGLMVQVKA